MRRTLLLPHTADTRLQVVADTPEELFLGALEGMNEIIKHDALHQPTSPELSIKINLSAIDQTVLLIDFLNEVLTQSVINGAVFNEISTLSLKDSKLIANLKGSKVTSFDEDIKAVTYHGAEIEQANRGNYQVTVVFDV